MFDEQQRKTTPLPPHHKHSKKHTMPAVSYTARGSGHVRPGFGCYCYGKASLIKKGQARWGTAPAHTGGGGSPMKRKPAVAARRLEGRGRAGRNPPGPQQQAVFPSLPLSPPADQ